MAFNQTFDERFGFDEAGINGGDPGDLDLAGEIGPARFGVLGPDIMGYGALAAPSPGEEDIDLYDLGVLQPGDYILETQNFGWGPPSGPGGVVRLTALSNDNIDANGFPETILGAGRIEFTVNEAANYFVRLFGRTGEHAQYTVNYYEEGTILRNNEAIFRPFVFEQDLLVGDAPFVTLRADDPDGRSQPGEIEYFLDGVSVATLPSADSFVIQPEFIGKFLTVRFSFVDDGNTRETSDFFSVGRVISQPNREAFFGIGSPLLDVEAGDTVRQRLSIFDEDGTDGAVFETDWFLDGALVFEGDEYLVPEAAIGRELSFVVSFTDDRGFFEESAPVSAGLVQEAASPLDDLGFDPDDFLSPGGTAFLTRAESVSLSGLGSVFDLTLTGSGDFFAIGNGNANTIRGNAGANRIEGLGADDVLRGRGGDDAIDGGDGADRLFGNGGGDRLKGGAGDDLLKGGGGGDTLIGNGGDDRLNAGGGSDLLRGGGGDDILEGRGGNDRVKAGGGADDIDGGGGRDNVNGGGGADEILGGRGFDILRGGGGRDVFQFRLGDGRDTITDFRQGQDRIEILSPGFDFADLSITQAGADVAIAFGNVRILVETDDAGAFGANDFIF